MRVKRVLIILARRSVVTAVQAFVISMIVFALVRALPGDPSFYLAGPNPRQERVEEIRQSLQLDESILQQYLAYGSNFLKGDWGRSFQTGNNVLEDILIRFPATLELISAAVLLGLIISIPWAVFSAFRPASFPARLGRLYGRLAGSVPDFWLAILLILVFFAWLGLAPAPVGRTGLAVATPERITGFLTLDSLLLREGRLFVEAVRHLALPSLSLSFVYSAVYYKQTRAGVERELNSPRTLYARACGLRQLTVARQVTRNAIPPIVALVGNSYAWMLGGAVLIESIFSWGGLGEYARRAIEVSDYFAISGVVLIASLFTLTVYFLVDLVSAILDPRMEIES